jgi:hypothetical protein
MMKVLLVRELKCGGLMIKCKLQFWNQLPLLMYILVVLCSHWMLKFVCSSLPGSTMVLLRSTTILTRGTRYCILLSLIFCPPLLYFLLISFLMYVFCGAVMTLSQFSGFFLFSVGRL